MNKVFACSDHHFFHRNIIKYADRPFELSENGVIQNADTMIRKHNERIADTDIVLMIGDLSICSKNRTTKLLDIITALNGRKVLIKGNHDNFKNQFYLDAGFIDVKDYLICADTFICHYPCYSSKWNKGIEPFCIKQLKKTNCTKIIHGHIHNKDPNKWESDGYSRTNVCVDYTENDFYPIELINNELVHLITEKYIL